MERDSSEAAWLARWIWITAALALAAFARPVFDPFQDQWRFAALWLGAGAEVGVRLWAFLPLGVALLLAASGLAARWRGVLLIAAAVAALAARVVYGPESVGAAYATASGFGAVVLCTVPVFAHRAWRGLPGRSRRGLAIGAGLALAGGAVVMAVSLPPADLGPPALASLAPSISIGAYLLVALTAAATGGRRVLRTTRILGRLGVLVAMGVYGYLLWTLAQEHDVPTLWPWVTSSGIWLGLQEALHHLPTALAIAFWVQRRHERRLGETLDAFA